MLLNTCPSALDARKARHLLPQSPSSPAEEHLAGAPGDAQQPRGRRAEVAVCQDGCEAAHPLPAGGSTEDEARSTRSKHRDSLATQPSCPLVLRTELVVPTCAPGARSHTTAVAGAVLGLHLQGCCCSRFSLRLLLQ